MKNNVYNKKFPMLYCISVFLFILSFNSSAQISTTKVAAPSKASPVKLVFDSTYNYAEPDKVESYIGQILFALPYDYKGSLSWRTEYQYSGQYFIVDSVVKRDVSNWDDNKYLYESWQFYLTNKDNPDITTKFVYETWNDKYWKRRFGNFPFLVMSHYNYIKKHYVGKQVITQLIYDNRDIVTGDTLIIPNMEKKVWTVQKVSILETKYKPLALIVTSGNSTAAIPIEYLRLADAQTNRYPKIVYLKSEWDKLVSTYGYSMVLAAFKQKIQIGMPLKLLIYSWGAPDRINSSSYGQQYIYHEKYDDPDYVYVRGGKVTGWN